MSLFFDTYRDAKCCVSFQETMYCQAARLTGRRKILRLYIDTHASTAPEHNSIARIITALRAGN